MRYSSSPGELKKNRNKRNNRDYEIFKSESTNSGENICKNYKKLRNKIIVCNENKSGYNYTEIENSPKAPINNRSEKNDISKNSMSINKKINYEMCLEKNKL